MVETVIVAVVVVVGGGGGGGSGGGIVIVIENIKVVIAALFVITFVVVAAVATTVLHFENEWKSAASVHVVEHFLIVKTIALIAAKLNFSLNACSFFGWDGFYFYAWQ